MHICPDKIFIRFHTMALIAILVMWNLPTAGASDPEKVMVLPFEIHATGDLSYLSSQIAEVLSNHLEKDGAAITKYPSGITASELDTTALDKLAQLYDVDRIIKGSFTLIGERFSLDAQILDPTDLKGPVSVSGKGIKLENLLKELKVLASDISLKLFQHEVVEEIRIQGNQRIEADAILRQVTTKIGSIYKSSQVTQDLKTIYRMGFFDDLRATSESGQKGIRVTFHVKEKPTVRRIRVKGNVRFDDEEIKENLTLSTGAILNIFKVRSNMEQIETMYKEKNYHQINVDYKVLPLENNQADIEFIIEEGPKVYVTSIVFEGNKEFTDKQLKKKIKTSEKGFFFWITSSGDLDRTKLEQDSALLNTFYSNQGYIQVKVADPVVDIGEKGIVITFKIDEGPQFNVGKVDISGDLIKPKEELIKDLRLGQSVHYSREQLRNDIISLTDLYGNEGYAYADIKPEVKEDLENKIVHVTYAIDKKQEVYFENILISGNTRTRDKVIRRELKVHETEKYNYAAFKKSMRNLHRLNYFEDIKVDYPKGSTDDSMVLKIDVDEKGTGQIGFGAGVSDAENLFLMGSVSQNNFLGRGQILSLQGQIGSSTNKYSLSFTEPWLFDIPLSATLFSYKLERVYDLNGYEEDSTGLGLRVGYPVFEYTRAYLSYAFDSSDVFISKPEKANDNIKELEGNNITNSITLAMVYDSRDSPLNPSEGSKHSFSYEHAGLGGDVGFNKSIFDTGWYFPLIKSLVGFVHGRSGFVEESGSDTILPDNEKFYLGGMHSIRGFDWRDIHLTKKNSEGVETKIGGTAMLQLNLEIIIPISKKLGLMGVVFYDAGNVYDDNIDVGDIRRSAGYGIRWISPLVPIRIEYGRILDRREGETNKGGWAFTMGGAF